MKFFSIHKCKICRTLRLKLFKIAITISDASISMYLHIQRVQVRVRA
jgi:hypothetical protein